MEVSHYTHQNQGRKKKNGIAKNVPSQVDKHKMGRKGKFDWGENNGRGADKTAFHL